MDYSDHDKVKGLLDEAQDVDKDNREKYRECEYFMHTPDGQWEPDITQRWQSKPRYTFDLVTGIIDNTAGEIENAEFSLKCRPAGGDATIDLAETFDGLLRDIQVRSNATDIYSQTGRRLLTGGFDAFRATQNYGEGKVFEQDLFVRPIINAVDCVWFDHNSREETGRDARHVFVLKPLARDAYREKYPKGSETSLSTDRWKNVYFNKPDDIVIGEILWLEPEKTEIVLMTNGAVYTKDEDFAKIQDELAQGGITIEQERTVDIKHVKSRIFDGGGWLSEKKDTVFTNRVPVIRCVTNFAVIEDKPVWRGKVERLMDPQRVLNYTSSKQVEDAVISSKKKIWSPRSALTDPDDLKDAQTINTNQKAVQLFDPKPGEPLPFELGGADIAPGVSEVNQNMRQILTPMDERMPGQALGARSGVAAITEQNAEDTKDSKYFSALKRAIQELGIVLVNAIPVVYDTKRTVRILGEDGTPDMVTIHDVVRDEETSEMVEKYDLSKGYYDVTCTVGQEFKNKQSEAVEAITKMAAVDPTLIQRGGDIWLKNAALPGMETLSERKRRELFLAGAIPPSQWTDEERAEMEQRQLRAANQPQEPSPEDKIAQAEMMKGQADLLAQQNKQTELQIKAAQVQVDQMNAETNRLKAETDAREAENKQKLTEAQANQANASAMKSAADGHSTMLETGLYDTDAAQAGVDVYNEAASDTLIRKGPRLVWDVTQGDFVDAASYPGS